MVDRTLYSGIPVCIRTAKSYWRLTSILFIGISVLTGCKNELPKDEYVAWVTDYDNGLHVRKESGDFIFDLQYKPSELIRLERDTDTSRADHLLQYFTLRIGTANQSDVLYYRATDVQSVERNLYYYSYLFQNDIHLEYKGEKFPCVLYHFERTVTVENMRTINLGFDVKPNEGDLFLVFTSGHISSLPIRLRITNQKVPKLQI